MTNEQGKEYFARLPVGWCRMACRENPQGPEIVWIVHDDSRKIKAAAGQKIAFNIKTIVIDDAAVVACLICVGAIEPGNIYEALINACQPGRQNWLSMLRRQADNAVYFIGDDGVQEGHSRNPNGLGDTLGSALARLSTLRPWSQAQFDRARETVCREHPDMMTLWTATERPTPAGRPLAAAEPARAYQSPGGEGLLSTVEVAIRGLHEPIQEVLLLLTPLRGAISLTRLEEYAQNMRLQPVLDGAWRLWDAAIARARERNLLRPHPADSAYLSIPEDFTAALRRRADGYLTRPLKDALAWAFHATYARAADDILAKYTGGDAGEKEAAIAAAGIEYENFAAALDYGLRLRLPVRPIYRALNAYLHESHHYRRGVELAELVLARLGPSGADAMGQFVIYREMSDHLRQLRQFDAAEECCHKALAIYRQQQFDATPVGKINLIRIHQKLGALAVDRGQWKRARKFFRQALQLSVATGVRAAEAACHCELSRTVFRLGEFSRARAHGRKAMQLFVALGNRAGQAGICIDFAYWAATRGKWNTARRYNRQALVYFIEFGNRRAEAEAHHNLGSIAQHQGKHERATRHFRRAIKIRREIGARGQLIGTYNHFGSNLAAAGDMDAARRMHARALKLARSLGDRAAEAAAWWHFAQLAKLRGRWRRARRYFRQAIELLEGAESALFLGGYHLDAGALAYEHGDRREARSHLLNGLRLFNQLTDARAREPAFAKLARIWRDSGDDELLAAVADVLKIAPEEAEERLRKFL